ncbi:A/G-specific adenine glycosylase [Opitutaceae bacterium EW11]|nr:A/G-specific adenine glycosylase [Opitutaceae bacterium EW11]
MPKTAADALVSRKSDFQKALLDWFHVHQRPLPWRTSPSLYKTVVSELMLQQTQVKTVLPYFDRWLRALPDFAALAAAPESQVLKLWEGLGYYSRARNLHRLAKAIAALPSAPRTPEAWRELPGVGPYTAAAITSIAFGAPVACVDGNVVRILARLTADDTGFRDSASAAKAFTALAQVLVPSLEPGDHNQAMMELGATVCTKANPLCTVCPVFAFCAGARTGQPEALPKLAAKKMERVSVVRVWCVRDKKLLLHRAQSSARRLADLHELPRASDVGLTDSTVSLSPLIAEKRRGITRYQITESIHAIRAQDLNTDLKQEKDGLHWVPLDELASITLSGPHKRWIGEMLAPRE